MSDTAKPFRLVRSWPHTEEKITETEGRVLDTLRKYTAAETNPQLMAEIEATNELETAMFDARDGRADVMGDERELSQEEVDALVRVAAIWERWVAEYTERAIEWAAEEATKEGATNG